MRRLLAASVIAVLWGMQGLAAAPPATAPTTKPVEADAPFWKGLLADLAAQDFNVREAAQKRLEGAPLEQIAVAEWLAREERDPEVKTRLEKGVAWLHDRLSTDPPGVSLHVKDASYADLNRALDAAMGGGVLVLGHESKVDDRFTLDMDNKPFWEVMAGLSIQNPIGLGESGLDSGGMVLREYCRDRGAAIFIHYATFSATSFPQAPGNVPARVKKLEMAPYAILDPRIHVLKTVWGGLMQVLDNAGHELKRMDQGSPELQPFLPNELGVPADAGDRLAEVRGEFRWLVSTKDVMEEYPDIAAGNGPYPVGSALVTVRQLEAKGDQLLFGLDVKSVVLEPEKHHVQLLDVAEMVEYQPIGISLFDGSGRLFFSRMTAWGIAERISPVPKGPYKMRLSFSTARTEMRVPFEFKDLPLPK